MRALGRLMAIRKRRPGASGPEALDQIDRVDPTVVVLDEMMPGMTGVQVAHQIRQRRPGQIMILCSAYLDISRGGGATEGPGSGCSRDRS